MLQHIGRFWKGFVAKNEVTTLEHPPQSPDLAAADFYILSRLKVALRVWNFCGATYIIKNATDELKRLSQKSFQECFQHLYSRCQKFTVAQGDYFEENVA